MTTSAESGLGNHADRELLDRVKYDRHIKHLEGENKQLQQIIDQRDGEIKGYKAIIDVLINRLAEGEVVNIQNDNQSMKSDNHCIAELNKDCLDF